MTIVIDDKALLSEAGIHTSQEAALALTLLAKAEGYANSTAGVITMLEVAMSDSVAPGWCTSCQQPGGECEPDARANWCEHCGNNAVESCLSLAGLI
jgi:hypothetical protein